MKRKEVLIAAVVGGCIGAVLTMSVGLFMPVGVVAQSYNHDATFGWITCRGIEVVDSSGEVMCRIWDIANGGSVTVFGKGTVRGQARMLIGNAGGVVDVLGKEGIGGGWASMHTDEHGGIVEVANNQSKKRAAMSVNAYDNGAVSTWDRNGNRQ